MLELNQRPSDSACDALPTELKCLSNSETISKCQGYNPGGSNSPIIVLHTRHTQYRHVIHVTRSPYTLRYMPIPSLIDSMWLATIRHHFPSVYSCRLSLVVNLVVTRHLHEHQIAPNIFATITSLASISGQIIMANPNLYIHQLHVNNHLGLAPLYLSMNTINR